MINALANETIDIYIVNALPKTFRGFKFEIWCNVENEENRLFFQIKMFLF